VTRATEGRSVRCRSSQVVFGPEASYTESEWDNTMGWNVDEESGWSRVDSGMESRGMFECMVSIEADLRW
jgi:hypothetical protein